MAGKVLDIFERDIAVTAVANSNVDVLSNNSEADFKKVPGDRVRVIAEMLMYGTAGSTTGRGIELYEGKDRKAFQNDYKETSLANYNDKKTKPNAAFSPGSDMVLFIQSGAIAASGRMKVVLVDVEA
ncbi:MAG: hypothetical protein ACREBU_05275 [Nitrososphaera sp.]